MLMVQLRIYSLTHSPQGLGMSNCNRHAFSYAGPHAWNLLTEIVQKSTSIAIVKRCLKTFLFEQIMHLEQRRFSFRLMGYTGVLPNSN